jgi:hypothetical protein
MAVAAVSSQFVSTGWTKIGPARCARITAVALLAMALLLYLVAWFAGGAVSKEVVEGTPEAATGAP